MASYYVNSAVGASGDGLSWATAKATLAEALVTPGDTIYVANTHEEVAAGGLALNFGTASTSAAPYKVICAIPGTNPLTAATTAVVRSGSGNSQVLALAFSAQIYGLIFRSNQGGTSGVSNLTLNTANNGNLRLENCRLEMAGAGSTTLTFGSSGANNRSVTSLKNVGMKFSSTSQKVVFNISKFQWDGGYIVDGGATPVDFISAAGAGTISADITGVDFSNFASTFNVCGAGMPAAGQITLRNCKMPSGWTGALVAGAPAHPGFRIEMYNCGGAGGSLAFWSECYGGSVKTDTATKKAGTDVSLCMATNTGSEVVPLETPELFAVNSEIGVSKTVSVDFAHDGPASLTNADIWLELFYQSTSSPSMAAVVHDGIATPLATAAPQDASGATWTAGARKQKVSVAITPQAAGVLIGKVVLAKPGTTVYVDPKLQVS